MKLRGIITKRKKGNCFSTCIVNGLQLLGEPDLNTPDPEYQIFTEQVLSDQDEAKELAPALDYLASKNYEIVIIDPDPYNGLWGNSIGLKNVKVDVRSYVKSDITSLVGHGYAVIFATQGSNSMPHAVLIYENANKIFDPENNEVWQSAFLSIEEYILRAEKEKQGKFLIAFKK